MEQRTFLEGLPDEETIRSVVHGLYSKVETDDLLAPVFEPRLAGHRDEHMETMVDFWSSILLSSGRYRGRPLAIHGELGDITPKMWARLGGLVSTVGGAESRSRGRSSVLRFRPGKHRERGRDLTHGKSGAG